MAFYKIMKEFTLIYSEQEEYDIIPQKSDESPSAARHLPPVKLALITNERMQCIPKFHALVKAKDRATTTIGIGANKEKASTFPPMTPGKQRVGITFLTYPHFWEFDPIST